MRTGYRPLTFLICCLIMVLAVRCGDKGTSPTHGIIGTWPAEATGLYERTWEARNCGYLPFGCDYKVWRTDTVAVCGDPTEEFLAYFLKGWSFPSKEIDGQIGTSIYYIVLMAGGEGYEYRITLSSKTTDRPPSHDGWQFKVSFECLTCDDWHDVPQRFTYTRIGDVDCAEVDTTQVEPM